MSAIGCLRLSAAEAGCTSCTATLFAQALVLAGKQARALLILSLNIKPSSAKKHLVLLPAAAHWQTDFVC
jgi:hypothetical protein